MKILEIDQRSLEWFQEHKGRFTGSNISDLVYKKDEPTKAFMDLVEQKANEVYFNITQYEIDCKTGLCVYDNYTPSIGINGKYGEIMEPGALEYYAKKYDEEIYTVGFIISDKWPDHVGCSPDALHTRKSSGVEMKCRKSLSVHRACLKMKSAFDLKKYMQKEYWQVIHNILVCEAESWDYVSYLPFVSPKDVMSCLVVNKHEIEDDLKELEKRIIEAIELKLKINE